MWFFFAFQIVTNFDVGYNNDIDKTTLPVTISGASMIGMQSRDDLMWVLFAESSDCFSNASIFPNTAGKRIKVWFWTCIWEFIHKPSNMSYDFINHIDTLPSYVMFTASIKFMHHAFDLTNIWNSHCEARSTIVKYLQIMLKCICRFSCKGTQIPEYRSKRISYRYPTNDTRVGHLARIGNEL